MPEYPSQQPELSSLDEMSGLVREVADHAAPSTNWKDRVRAAARVLSLTPARAKALYYREARRVEAGEMDRARAATARFRAARQRARELEHLAWLREQVAGMDGIDVDAVQRLLGGDGDEAGAVALPEDAEA